MVFGVIISADRRVIGAMRNIHNTVWAPESLSMIHFSALMTLSGGILAVTRLLEMELNIILAKDAQATSNTVTIQWGPLTKTLWSVETSQTECFMLVIHVQIHQS